VSEKSFIKFLGTAGARFVVSKQLRASGGVWYCLDAVNFLVDPGPGSLVRCLASKPKLDPAKLEAILLSHLHIDHSNDINILIEAMTAGGFKRRGHVFAPLEALEPEPVILPYVRGYCERIHTLRAGGEYTIAEKVRFRTPVRHKHGAETYGFIFEAGRHRIAHITCTQFFAELEKSYTGDLVILHVVRYQAETEPEGQAQIKHLNLEDARRLILAIRPRTAILTHFGMTMLRAKPWELAAKLSEETGIEVIAATDGMRYELP
jgi:phosphoribosyl 1,2-cyclic phosphodiesterase